MRCYLTLQRDKYTIKLDQLIPSNFKEWTHKTYLVNLEDSEVKEDLETNRKWTFKIFLVICLVWVNKKLEEVEDLDSQNKISWPILRYLSINL